MTGSAFNRNRSRLRNAGVIVFALGIIVAGSWYWARTRSPDLSDDAAMLQFSKPQRRQMGLLYGPMGNLIEDLSADAKRPGVQAIVIAGVSAAIAGVCFLFGRPVEDSDPNADLR
jgi:hypothetical protein